MSNKVKTVLGSRVILVPPEASYKAHGAFREVQVSTNVGIVKHLGVEVGSSIGLELGQKVVYGSEFEQVQMENQTVYSMDYKNIIAVLED